MTLESEIKKLFDIKCEIDKTIRKMRYVNYTFTCIFGAAILYSIITLTAVHTRQVEQVIPEVQKLKDESASITLVLNIMKSFQVELRKADAISRRDSTALREVSKEFDELRIELYRDLRMTRGSNIGGLE